jgi:argininosuccinate synthase
MSTIVLAYSGGFASSNAVHWLTEQYGADVVTVTLDVGQGDELGAVRARALLQGAVRAHAIDAREELVREYLLPSLVRGPLSEGPGIAEFTRPLIARKLLEVARIEGASIVAHASLDESLDAAIRALDPRIEILAPARLWKMDAPQLSDYARTHGVPPRPAFEPHCRIDQSLWGRVISFRDLDGRPTEAHLKPVSTSSQPAHINLQFEAGIPVSINDVPMPPVELVESLALIAGGQGVGRLESTSNGRTVVYDAPAAMVLHTARAALGDRTGVVRLSVLNGGCTVVGRTAEVVNLA